jgi:hypothetical protein
MPETTKAFREGLRQFFSFGPPLAGSGKRGKGAKNGFDDKIGGTVGDIRRIPWPCTPYRSLRLPDDLLKKTLSTPGSFAHPIDSTWV